MNPLGSMETGRSRRASALFLLIFLISSSSMIFQDLEADGSVTRAEVMYIGYFDGEGEGDDILLAGHRWYQCNFTFIDWVDEVERAVVHMDYGSRSQDLMDYAPSELNYSVGDRTGMVDVRDPMIVQAGGNLTLSFEIWMNINWSHETEDIELSPSVWSGGEAVNLDFLHRLRFDVDGKLEPMAHRIDVIGPDGAVIDTGDPVRAGSDVSVTGISFQYYDPSGRFAGLEPDINEIEPLVSAGGERFNTTKYSGGYIADLTVPDTDVATVEISLELDNIRSSWLYNLDGWAFTLWIDGMGPRIEKIKPIDDKIQGGRSFQWNISVTDRPVETGVSVNGSTVQYRIWTLSGNWTDWSDAENKPNGRSISFEGNATGQPGEGNTRIQFRAEDVLGNINISEIYQIRINVRPVIEIPNYLNGMVLMNNRSLVLDGDDLASDDDGTDLDFQWYLDDSGVLSTGEEFRKPLFDEKPGQHTVKLVVSDGFESVEASFNIMVEEAPEETDDRSFLQKAVEDENFFWYMLPVVLVIVLIPIIVIILVLSRKMSEAKRDDFIIDEDRAVDMSEAEQTAKKLMENMSYSAEDEFEMGAEAGIDSEGFDFSYDLYEVLGLESNASAQEIKKKYRKKAAYYHPDRVAQHKEVTDEEAREEMVKVNKAKEILLDSEERARYDDYVSDSDFDMDMSDFEIDGEDDDDFGDEWG